MSNGSLWHNVQSRKGLRESILVSGKVPVFASFGSVPMLQSYRPSPLYSLPKALSSPAPFGWFPFVMKQIDTGKLRKKGSETLKALSRNL